MKELYHICFTSHDEVMYREEEDIGMFVNLLGLRSFADDTEVYVDSEMSTHAHLGVMSARPMVFARNLRISYSKYFNYKYGRKGRLGQKYTFVQLVIGFLHQLMLEIYILRNGLHHAVAATAFGYPYCSVRDLFAKELGYGLEPSARFSRQEMASFLPRHAEFPDEYEMNASGVFVRRSFMQIRQAEQYFVSPRNYLYQMNRLTTEDWIQEQIKDNTGAPLTIGSIEQADEYTVAQLLKNENGRNYKPSGMQDLDVCRLIDKDLLPSYRVASIY